MGTRNTPEQQRRYSQARRARLAQSGRRQVQLDLHFLLLRRLDQEAKRIGLSRSAVAEMALGDWLLSRPVDSTETTPADPGRNTT
jgi:hypothetical protein